MIKPSHTRPINMLNIVNILRLSSEEITRVFLPIILILIIVETVREGTVMYFVNFNYLIIAFILISLFSLIKDPEVLPNKNKSSGRNVQNTPSKNFATVKVKNFDLGIVSKNNKQKKAFDIIKRE